MSVTQQEAQHACWEFGYEGGFEPGGFTRTLMSAITRADAQNLSRLRLAFPGYVEAMKDRTKEQLEAIARDGGEPVVVGAWGFDQGVPIHIPSYLIGQAAGMQRLADREDSILEDDPRDDDR